MAALVAAPSWFPTWVFILALWLVPAGWFLSTATGRLALVDERVRQVEAFGGRVDAAEYDRLVQRPPWEAYFTSGGRLLLSPPITVLIAAGLMVLARLDRAPFPFAGALAVSVHASVPLAIQQLITVPVSYLAESLTSPTNLAAVLRLENGTVGARLFGAVDLFGLWWTWLLALGLSAATGRPAGRYLVWLMFIYVGTAAALAAAMILAGGF